ncbi:hypothetical protein Lal_00042872 [Lupinus albus]|nr:hypothetical protein Lal_00042872 [Lupinus albus]
MYAIKYSIKINCSQMIMRQMWNVRGSQSPLPYAIFITKFLEHFVVSLNGETKMAFNLRESKIDVEVVHKMEFSLDPDFLGFLPGRDLARLGEGEGVDIGGSLLERERQI